ncbi:MAG: TIGR01458 family HAD-type hydrolase [Gemmatimonadetes bacterium]|nr:MAG: TIGR01458 family HAD-type hydrolase [Gemmatimonadota bacterium]
MSEMFELISGFLIDIDGVLYIDQQPIAGAVECITAMREEGFALRFLTNTTRKTRDMLHAELTGMGFPIEKHEIISAPYAALHHLQQQPEASAHFVMNEALLPDFAGIRQEDEHPTYVVVGDLGEAFTYERLNTAFRCLMNGAELLAFQKNRYWRRADGLCLDAGAYVALLEFAADKNATIFGKPAPRFFRTALEDLGLPPHQVVMIGDDIETDIRGAQGVSIEGILVKTGKYREDIVSKSTVSPDLVINSIADLIDLL